MKLAPVVFLVCALVFVSSARGEDRLRVDRTYSLIYVGLGAAVWGVGETVIKADYYPDPCRWCGTNGLDESVRDQFKWDDVEAARELSNITGYGLSPLLTFAVVAAGARDAGGDVQGRLFEDFLVVAESVITTGMVTIVVKSVVGRERPFVRDFEGEFDKTPDLNLSFFSGHASLCFSAVSSAATVAYLRGYKSAPWVLVLGVPAAAATGYFRIAGDKHYLTDVVAGAAVGSAIGFAVPYFLHTGEEVPAAVPTLTYSRGTPFLTWAGTF